MHLDRDRIVRLLTFWLRPAFVLRVYARFQRIAGFDRSIALASSAFTALIPLTIFAAAVLPHVGGGDAGDRIIDRFDLTGAGAKAVKDVFSTDPEVSGGLGVAGTLLLLIAVLSFTRAVQRLYEQTWELPALSVRNSLNGLVWIGSFVAYAFIAGGIRRVFDDGLIEIPADAVLVLATCGFLLWTGRKMSASRISWSDLLPASIIGTALLAGYSIGASVYVPHLFESYASRYGVIGAVFAIISWLFGMMVVVVGSVVVGREVTEELARIRRGERPSHEEVRQEWDVIIAQGRERWVQVRERSAQFRERLARDRDPDPDPPPG